MKKVVNYKYHKFSCKLSSFFFLFVLGLHPGKEICNGHFSCKNILKIIIKIKAL